MSAEFPNLTEVEQAGPFCETEGWDEWEDPARDMPWLCTLRPDHGGEFHVAHGIGGNYITHWKA